MTDRELVKWRAERRRAEKEAREAGPKKEIIELLEKMSIRFFRLQSGDILGRAGGRGKWRVKGNKAGTPDFLCMFNWDDFPPPKGVFYHQGRVILWIECKSPSGKQSKEQVEFQKDAESRGETYLLARSAQEVDHWILTNGDYVNR
jgi:hypothetical protein